MKYSARITSEELEKMGFVAFEGNVQVITEVGEEFFKAIKYLKEQRVIGFDTETKPCFIQKMPRNKMAILQLSGADRAFIFRLQQIGLPDKLAKLLANPSVKKIGAAVPEHMIFEVLSMELIMMYSILKQINVLPETTMQRLSVRKKLRIRSSFRKILD